MFGKIENGIYVLDLENEVYSINTKWLKSESLNFPYLWHCRLGHVSDKRVSYTSKVTWDHLIINHMIPVNLVLEARCQSLHSIRMENVHRDIRTNTFRCMWSNVNARKRRLSLLRNLHRWLFKSWICLSDEKQIWDFWKVQIIQNSSRHLVILTSPVFQMISRL